LMSALAPAADSRFASDVGSMGLGRAHRYIRSAVFNLPGLLLRVSKTFLACQPPGLPQLRPKKPAAPLAGAAVSLPAELFRSLLALGVDPAQALAAIDLDAPRLHLFRNLAP